MQLVERETQVCECVSLIGQWKETSMARDFEPTQMHLASQEESSQISCQAHRNVAIERGLTMRPSKEGED